MNPSASSPSPLDGKLLDSIRTPQDVKNLAPDQLPRLAEEIRQEMIEVTSRNGGHLGPNLGVVELTIALHRIFSTPEDQFVFDVAHQGYVHKLLTGRGGEAFRNLRTSGGVSGFLYRPESVHDSFGAGHAGTGLSAALGMATARDLRGSQEHVVALIGDASLTCGITMEALNNAAVATKRLIIILNDNEWSISRNVGAISKYLNELSRNPMYNRIHHDLESFLKRVPGGDSLLKLGARAKEGAKNILVPSSLFENYGLRYLGPIDGHDFGLLLKNLEFAKHSDCPIVLHVLTTKGKGYEIALQQPERFHGVSPFDIKTGKSRPGKAGSPPNYQDVFGQALARFAKEDSRVVGITAAMPPGTGLSYLAKESPHQFFDVGIAEEHAVIFAAGMATKGYRPICAIYSTFLQRAYDPIIHDVCLQNLPVTFCLDRAGLSPADGPTHHGLFDIAYARCVPNAVLMQPKDEDELVDMLHTSLRLDGPAFIRYPRGGGTGAAVKARPQLLPVGRAEVLREGSDIVLWALGTMVQDALALADRLSADDGLSVGVVNARFIKPLDRELLLRHAGSAQLLVTLEDHVLAGGFGSAVLEALEEEGVGVPVQRIGWPDTFVEHGTSVEVLRAAYGLSPENIYRRVRDRFLRRRSESVEALA